MAKKKRTVTPEREAWSDDTWSVFQRVERIAEKGTANLSAEVADVIASSMAGSFELGYIRGMVDTLKPTKVV